MGYFLAYFLTERLIPMEKCHLIHSKLDDMIPFREEFVVFYVYWYLLVFGTLLYFFLYNVESYKRASIFIIVTQVVATIVYIVYPNVQDLRPEIFPRQNVFTWVLGIIYAFDTPTGVCPSLHVAYSMGIVSVSLKDPALPKPWKAALVFVVFMICLAVCFVKQHSTIDVFAALPVSLLAEALVYGKDYWLPRLRGDKARA